MSTEIGTDVAADVSFFSGPALAQSLLEEAPDGVVVVDADGLIRLVNRRTEELFGFSRAELLGRSVDVLIPDAVTERRPEHRATGSQLHGIHRDGRMFPVDVALSTMVAADDRVLTTALVRDISENRRMERRFQELLDSAPDAVVIIDHEGVVQLINRQAEAVLGYGRHELVGRPVETLVPESLRSRHPAHRGRYARDGGTRPMGAGLQLRARRRDGSEFPADIALSTLSDDAEGRLSVMATIRDVTDRHAAEQHLQALLDSAPDAMVIVGNEGRIGAVNRQTELLFGYTRSELVGQQVEILIPEQFRAAHPSHRARYTSAPVTRPMGAGLDLRARRRDGSDFPAEIALSALPDVSGGFQVTVTIRDATARAELERELRRSIEHADTANAAKSEFLSRMSHELRTPLNAVLGFAQILELDELTEGQAEAVDQIVRAGQHLLELINEVLDIARIESGRLAIATERVPLADVLDEVRSLIEPLARARQITVVQGARKHPAPFVLADRQRLKQVLLNVLSNAVKYNRLGGRVDLDWSCDAGTVRISVRDTGPGIASDKLHRLFDPFDRLDAEQTDVEGTGIGLAITLKLVHAMDGDVSVDSAPEQGTTVTVVLPRAPQDDGAVLPGPTATAVGTGPDDEPPAKLWTALYVEDNLPNLRLMEHIFARRPHWQLVHALHGSLGVILARSQQPDVILLDLHLPDMPGTVVLDRLRGDPLTASIPVHIVTADATPEQRPELERLGVDGFLTKPISVAVIYAIIDRLEELSATPGA